MTDIVVRQAVLGDVQSIVGIHTSGVEWTRKDAGGVSRPASYDELSIEERMERGGPWMSIETCAIHLNNMLLRGNPVLVAELGGKVVGTAELFIGDEPEPFGRNCHLSILWVHCDYRGKGIGTRLMEECVCLARALECETFSTLPDDEAEGFYGRFGMGPFYEQKRVELAIAPGEGAYVAEDVRGPAYQAADMTLRVGRYQSAKQQWDQATWGEYALTPDVESHPIRKIVSRQGELYIAVSGVCGSKERAYVYAWTAPSLDLPATMSVVMDECARRGFGSVVVLVGSTDVPALVDEMGGEVTGGQCLWAARLGE